MSRFDHFCQSCGMPLEKDPAHGGTEQNGTKSQIYCSYCYENGQFKDSFKTAGEMVDFVKGQLKTQGYGWIKQWFFT